MLVQEVWDMEYELRKFSDMHQGERGQVCNLLLSLCKHRTFFSVEFNETLNSEIKRNLDYFKENYEIYEVERVIPQKTYVRKELKLKDGEL